MDNLDEVLKGAIAEVRKIGKTCGIRECILSAKASVDLKETDDGGFEVKKITLDYYDKLVADCNEVMFAGESGNERRTLAAYKSLEALAKGDYIMLRGGRA